MLLKNGFFGRAPKNFFEATPSITSENALFAKYNIVVFIINLRSKEEKLVVKSYTLCTTSVNYEGDSAPCP